MCTVHVEEDKMRQWAFRSICGKAGHADATNRRAGAKCSTEGEMVTGRGSADAFSEEALCAARSTLALRKRGRAESSSESSAAKEEEGEDDDEGKNHRR